MVAGNLTGDGRTVEMEGQPSLSRNLALKEEWRKGIEAEGVRSVRRGFFFFFSFKEER